MANLDTARGAAGVLKGPITALAKTRENRKDSLSTDQVNSRINILKKQNRLAEAAAETERTI